MISHDSPDLVSRKQLIQQQAGGSAAIKMIRQELVASERAAQNDSAKMSLS